MEYEKPLLTSMLQYKTPDEAVGAIRNGLTASAEAFGLQWESIEDKYKSMDSFKRILSEMGEKPVYVTNYRSGSNDGKSDEKLAEEMLELADNGATLCDVMGDMFSWHPEELTDNSEAIKKQMEYIEKLHEKGAEVLMSSHVLKYTPAERVLEIALEQKRRGADIIKIVTGAENMQQQIENLKTTDLLKNELGAPFLFLSGGECSLHRRLGMKLGCCMCLCVYEHYAQSTPTPPPAGCPEWMGLEIAGVIVEMGDEAKEKSDWKIGDKVCALLGGGGYAEYVAVKYDMLMPVPKNCSMVEAAAIPEAFATAYLNLFIEGNIKEGNTLLMNAGASGFASVIIPMAKAFGIRVITTVLTEDKAESIKHLNADRVVVTEKEDIAEVLKEELEKGHSVDVAIDCLGGEIMGKCIHYLTHGARWVMIAALAGQKTEIDLKNIYVRNVRIIGSTLRSRTPETKAQILSELVKNVFPKIESGEVKPTIYKVLPITEAEAAHDILYKGENVGKVVLTVR